MLLKIIASMLILTVLVGTVEHATKAVLGGIGYHGSLASCMVMLFWPAAIVIICASVLVFLWNQK